MGARIDANGKCLTRSANVPSVSAFTIMGWCRREADRNTVSSFGYLRSAVGGGSSCSGVQTGSDGDALGIYVDSLSATFHTMVNAAWFFVGWKGDGTNVIGFARAAGAGSLTTATIADNDTAAALLAFGDRFVSGTEWMNCTLAAIKVWDSVLDNTQILAESQQMSPIILTNLNAWWLLNDVQQGADQSGNGRNLTVNGAITFTADLPDIPLTGDPIYAQASYGFYNADGGLGEPA